MFSESSELSCVVLVGGLGSRLRPLSWERPKPLMPLGAHPALVHLLDPLREAPVRRVLLAAGYALESMQDFARTYAHRYAFPLEVYEEKKPLGTGGAVVALRFALDQGPALILNGDTLVALRVGEMLELHRSQAADLTMAVAPVEDVSRYGQVRLEGDRLLAFGEKSARPEPGWINAGAYLMSPQAVRSLPPTLPLSLERDVFPLWLKENKICLGWRVRDHFLDIGTPLSYLEAQKLALSWAGETMVSLGEHTQVGPDVRFEGPVVVGVGCRIGARTRLSQCVLWDHVVVGADCDLEDCILGSEVVVPAGSRIRRQAQVVKMNYGVGESRLDF